MRLRTQVFLKSVIMVSVLPVLCERVINVWNNLPTEVDLNGYVKRSSGFLKRF